MKTSTDSQNRISRRDFVRGCAVGTAALASGALLGCRSTASREVARRSGPAAYSFSLDQDWLFGGPLDPAALEPGFADAAFARVTLPHCVSPLSWQNWDPALWERQWVYRHHWQRPRAFQHRRAFLDFERVMVGVTPVVNGQALAPHLGGYLPFHYEITQWLVPGHNVLALAVDSRWSKVPPEGSPRGPRSIDYLEPGGVLGSVRLRAVPSVFISDVFAKPVQVLDSQRRVEVTCTLDAGVVPSAPIRVEATLQEGPYVLARAAETRRLEKTGETELTLTLTDLGNVTLWDVDTPHLYDVLVTLSVGNKPLHDYRTRIGFREARFELDGFFLNGRRLQLFGLDRHELFPYVGAAMPQRVLRRDAEILRREFHCNAMRCSHYPQSEAFLDACDELGLMVWEEIPGWQYIGGPAWKDLAVRDVQTMVRRDRNHPAIIIWGVRINESANDPAFYRRTKAAAKALDDSRPTSGAMNHYSKKDWVQDVFAYDDYHAAPDGTVGLRPPLPGVPFFFSEAVGQFEYGTGRGFGRKYRRAGDLETQERQAILHAQAHDRGLSNKRYCGVIAWCAYDYGSLINSYHVVKCPGVADVFRIPKLGASFYRSQVDPKTQPVIEPNFYWDFGPHSPTGPGKRVAIFSNCDRLELFLGDQRHAVLHPDRVNYPRIQYAPFFADLELAGGSKPDLHIHGYIGNQLVLARSFSANPATDQLWLRADDAELWGDGSDATRLVFRAVDKYGAPRPFVGGKVTLEFTGPGSIVGDNPFAWAESGGVGAVWIKSAAGRTGLIEITATHPTLGNKSVEIEVRPVQA